MDCERKTDLGDAERQAIQKLDSELRSHGIVSQRAYNLTGAVLARMPEARLRDVSQSRKVAEESRESVASGSFPCISLRP